MISREQFALVAPAFEALRKTTRPRKNDLYDVFNAVLFALENDTPWRLLPGPLPWRTVHEYFTQWTVARHPDAADTSVLYRVLVDLRQYDQALKLEARLEANKKYTRPTPERKAA